MNKYINFIICSFTLLCIGTFSNVQAFTLIELQARHPASVAACRSDPTAEPLSYSYSIASSKKTRNLDLVIEDNCSILMNGSGFVYVDTLIELNGLPLNSVTGDGGQADTVIRRCTSLSSTGGSTGENSTSISKNIELAKK